MGIVLENCFAQLGGGRGKVVHRKRGMMWIVRFPKNNAAVNEINLPFCKVALDKL